MNTAKKILVLLLALCLVVGVVGCGAKKDEKPAEESAPEVMEPEVTPEPEQPEETKPEETETEETKQEEQKPVMLVASFGTSYNESRDITIGAVETALQKAYPEYEVRRAFTSQIIIDILKEREGLEIDNVTEAMERLVADGVKEVVVQPTHVMEGFEYDDVMKEIKGYKDQFESLKIGHSMLQTDEDYETLVQILAEETKDYNAEGTAIVFMGHGTEHASNATYAKLQEKVTEAGLNNYFIGTVEATPSLDDVLDLVRESGATKVVLEPLMIVAGDHANNDMAGDEEDSWKSVFEAAGFEVECVLRGLGEMEGVQQLIVKHASEAEKLPEGIAIDKLVDGTYDISVESNSSMFNIVSCKLTVAGGKATAEMKMSGEGYGKVYMGTGEEAEAADESTFIMDQPDPETGKNVFTVPVEMLDESVDCAAWSKKKEKWYDRTLVFQSDLLPDEAFAE